MSAAFLLACSTDAPPGAPTPIEDTSTIEDTSSIDCPGEVVVPGGSDAPAWTVLFTTLTVPGQQILQTYTADGRLLEEIRPTSSRAYTYRPGAWQIEQEAVTNDGSVTVYPWNWTGLTATVTHGGPAFRRTYREDGLLLRVDELDG